MGAGSVLQPNRRMKMWSRIVRFVIAIGLVVLAGRSFAGSACLLTLQWGSSLDPDVAGYALYYGPAGKPPVTRVDVGLQTTAVVTGLTAAVQYSFYVVAYDGGLNESDPSNLLLYSPPAISYLKLAQSADGAMKISFRVAPGAACRVEYTDTLSPPHWNLLTTATGGSNGVVVINDPMVTGSRFYRGAVQ